MRNWRLRYDKLYILCTVYDFMRKDCFIKVKIDIDNLKLSASARTTDGWDNLGLDQDIPLDILDRFVPTDQSAMTTDTQEEVPPLS